MVKYKTQFSNNLLFCEDPEELHRLQVGLNLFQSPKIW